MNNLIGFSTGPIHSWRESLDEQIDILKQLSLDAIELNFGRTDELNTAISSENINYLRSLPFVSIHAPFWNERCSNFYYKNTDRAKTVISQVRTFYELVDAKAVCFHPDLLNEKDLLKDSGMNICLENLTGFSGIDLGWALKRFPQYGVVLDTAHALGYGISHMNGLIKEYADKIKYVHFSDFRYSEFHGKEKPHRTFYGCAKPVKFRRVKDLDCPIIIENSLKNEKGNYSVLEKEVSAVREFFN